MVVKELDPTFSTKEMGLANLLLQSLACWLTLLEIWRANQIAHTCWSHCKNGCPNKKNNNTPTLWLAEFVGLAIKHWTAAEHTSYLWTWVFPLTQPSFHLQTTPTIMNKSHDTSPAESASPRFRAKCARPISFVEKARSGMRLVTCMTIDDVVASKDLRHKPTTYQSISPLHCIDPTIVQEWLVQNIWWVVQVVHQWKNDMSQVSSGLWW